MFSENIMNVTLLLCSAIPLCSKFPYFFRVHVFFLFALIFDLNEISFVSFFVDDILFNSRGRIVYTAN